MNEQNLYVYGLLGESNCKKYDITGIDNNEVFTFNHQNLAAVVSNINRTEIDPTRKNLLAHTKVQEYLLREYTVIPMSFGVITREERIKTMLAENYFSFQHELKRLADKIEIELKIYWNKDAVKAQIEKNPRYREISAKIPQTSSAEVKQDLLIEIGQIAEKVVLNWQDDIGRDIYDNMASLAVEACSNTTKEITNILDASFLVNKKQENEFRDRVYKLDAKYQNKIDIKYIGPLPPYNFIQVELKGE